MLYGQYSMAAVFLKLYDVPTRGPLFCEVINPVTCILLGRKADAFFSDRLILNRKFIRLQLATDDANPFRRVSKILTQSARNK